MLALLFPVPRKCRRPYLGCNSCLGGQFRANLVLEIAYSAEFSLYFSLFLGESSSLVTASSAIFFNGKKKKGLGAEQKFSTKDFYAI
jgi:hypothetical protein